APNLAMEVDDYRDRDIGRRRHLCAHVTRAEDLCDVNARVCAERGPSRVYYRRPAVGPTEYTTTPGPRDALYRGRADQHRLSPTRPPSWLRRVSGGLAGTDVEFYRRD